MSLRKIPCSFIVFKSFKQKVSIERCSSSTLRPSSSTIPDLAALRVASPWSRRTELKLGLPFGGSTILESQCGQGMRKSKHEQADIKRRLRGVSGPSPGKPGGIEIQGW